MSGSTPWRSTRGQRLLALSQGHNDWYRLRNSTDGPTQLHIYDEIGFMGVSASDLIVDLAGVTGALDVHLNSPGGEVNEGLAIYNCLLARDDVTIYIDGIAASIATVIAMAGTKILIAETAQMMVHNAFSMAIGDAEDFRQLADRLDENTSNIAGIYAQRTGKTAAHWLEIMKNEGWYRGKEAVEAGLADGLIPTRSKRSLSLAASSSFDMSVISNRAGDDLHNAAHHPYTGQHDHSHPPMSGVHSHNHAAFGHSDHDDGIHAHSHHHDNDAVHDHGHMSHGHGHDHEHPHEHAHDAGQHSYGTHQHDHTHHVFDPDHDGDDDSRPDDGHGGGDTDHDYFALVREHIVSAADPAHIMAAGYDDSAWDGSAAMSSAASSSNPASALNSICAGKRAGDPSTKAAHALPHHKHPGSPPNKAGVTAALASLHGSREGVKGLTNRSAAEAHLNAHAAAWASKSGGSEPSDHQEAEIFSEADAQALIGILKEGM